MPVQFAVQHGLHRMVSRAWLEPLAIVLSLFAAWVLHALAEQPAQRLSRRIGRETGFPRNPRAAPAEV
jgi:peptidoglycan/LPS O-acetylase OafA/YrhL